MTGPTADFTRRLDPQGRVVYFAVNGRPMLFNGHAGTFYDSLPRWAERILAGATRTDRPRPALQRRAEQPRGRADAGFRREVALFRTGRHPSLESESRQQRFESAGGPNAVNVFLAQGCNLACRYCVNDRGTFGGRPAFMSRETAREVVAFVRDLAANTAEPALRVNFLGGEPLLARAAAHELARGLQDLNHAQAGAQLRLILYTNGTRYDESVFRIFAERPDLCTVVVSLDGPPDTHDRNRPFVNARGTYATVLTNLQKLIQDGIPHSVTCVVTKPYEYVGAAEELHRIGVTRLELKDVIDHIYGGSGVPADCTGDFDAWRARYLAYTDYFLDYLHSSRPALHVDRYAIVQEFGRVLNRAEDFDRTLACGVADEKISVAADGRILPCEGFVGQPQFELGTVRSGFDRARLAEFEQRLLIDGQLRLDHGRCRECFAKRLCGGGCYAQSLEKTGRIEPFDERACQVTREKTRIDLYFLARLKAEHPAVFTSYGGLLE